MARSFLNNEELIALRGLPHAARTLYREGLRPYMDYSTSVVGVTRRLSYQQMLELLEVRPDRGSKEAVYRPTQNGIRNMLKQLQRVEMVYPVAGEGGKALPLVFFLAMADSDLNRPDQERQRNNSKEQQQEQHPVPLVLSHAASVEQQHEKYSEDANAGKEQHTSEYPSDITYPSSSKTVVTNTSATAADDDLKVYQQEVRRLLIGVGMSLRALTNPKAVRCIASWHDQGASLAVVEQAIAHGYKHCTSKPNSPVYFTSIIHDFLTTGVTGHDSSKRAGSKGSAGVLAESCATAFEPE